MKMLPFSTSNEDPDEIDEIDSDLFKEEMNEEGMLEAL